MVGTNAKAPVPSTVVVPARTSSMNMLTMAPAAAVPAMLGRASRVFSAAAGVLMVGTATVHALVPEHVAPVGQSLVPLQRTHCRVDRRHEGVAPVQLVSLWHCTHVFVAVSQMADGDAQSLFPKHPTINVAEIVGDVDETASTPEPKDACAAKVCVPVVNADGTSKVQRPCALAVALPPLTASINMITVAPTAAVPVIVGVGSLKLAPSVGDVTVGAVIEHAFVTHSDEAGQFASVTQRTHALSLVRQWGVAPAQSGSAKQPEIKVKETVGLAALETANRPAPTLAVANVE